MREDDLLVHHILEDMLDYYEKQMGDKFDKRLSLILDGIQKLIDTLED
jgi:hypothetical protein